MGIGIVNTKYGKLQGVEQGGKCEGITLFKGIPYAAPPVGKLRWAPPAEPEAWDGVKVCDNYGPVPFQKFMYEDIENTSVIGGEFYYMGNPEVSEDCLYINICTGAAKAGEKRPVYLWHHGGGLTNGYSYEVEFDPSELAKKGIVVVQVGQRLGPFGYISLPQLTAELGKSGNYGLMDQIKALDWVYENIAAFGGDPENITVGGQSGGTWRATAVASTPVSKGRVKRVIAQSWIVWMMKYLTLTEAEEIGTDYLKLIGVDPNISLTELRAIDASKLFGYNVPRNLLPGDMVFDGELVPYRTQWESFDKYIGDGVDYLGGVTFGEVDVFSGLGSDKLFFAHHKKAGSLGANADQKLESVEEFYGFYKNLLGELYNKYDFKNLVKVTEDNVWRTARRLAALGLCELGKTSLSRSLMMHRMFGMYMAKRYPKNSVYTYIWSHLLPIRPEDIGGFRDQEKLLAFHASELWFTFGSLGEGIPPHRPWREVDYKLADIVSSYWANFMRTGNPNGEGLPEWTAAGEDYGYMDLDTEVKGGKGAGSGLDALMREFCTAAYDISL